MPTELDLAEALRAEFLRGRFESEGVRRLLSGRSPIPWAIRACHQVRRGFLGSARHDAEEALARGAGSAHVQMLAATVWFETRDYDRALSALRFVVDSGSGLSLEACRLAIDITSAIGWKHDARAWLDETLAQTPDDLELRRKSARAHLDGRSWGPALADLAAARALAPTDGTILRDLARAAAAAGRRDESVDALEAWVALPDAESPESRWLEASEVAADAGDLVLAQRYARAACAASNDSPESLARVADLSLHRGDVDDAEATALRVLAIAPDHAAAMRVLGAVRACRGRWEEALPSFERAAQLDDSDYRTHLFLGEAYHRLGDRVRRDAHVFAPRVPPWGFSFVPWMLQILADENLPDPVPSRRTDEVDGVLAELVPVRMASFRRSRSAGELHAAILEALDALRGNRSVVPTHVVDGVWKRLETRGGARHDSRWALQLLASASPEVCLARFDDVLARYPESSLPLCHRGELKLWLGDFDGARRDLEAAIALEPKTRWAYMGLSTLDLLAGDPEACLATNARGVEALERTEGPAIHAFRGEALFRLGRLEEALAALERAVASHPARVGSVIALALAQQAAGRDVEFARTFRRLVDDQATGLMVDAAAESGVVLFADPGVRLSDEDARRVLERALAMLGGNRSSGLVTYRTAAGRLRFVHLWPYAGRRPHEGAEVRLLRAEQALFAALARR